MRDCGEGKRKMSNGKSRPRPKLCRNCGTIFLGHGAQAYCSDLCRKQRRRRMMNLIVRKIREENHDNIDTLDHSDNPTMNLSVIYVHGQPRIKGFINMLGLKKNP